MDLAVLTSAYVLAYTLRFEGSVPVEFREQAIAALPGVVFLQYVTLTAFGVPRFSWRHFGLRDAVRMVQAFLGAALVLGALRVLGGLSALGSWSGALSIPFGVIGIDLAVALILAGGARAIRRLTAERGQQKEQTNSETSLPTLLIGAGSAGVLVAKELAARPNLNMKPLGFVDDDPAKHGRLVHGFPVLDSIERLPEVAARLGAHHALLSIASANGDLVRRVQALCVEADLKLKIVPGVYEIVDGRVGLTRVREVEIQDLLRRKPVELDMEALHELVDGKTVLVTGAGGSIGSELCRQILRFKPQRLVLVEQSEPALYEIHRELANADGSAQVLPCMGDVCDDARMRQVFQSTTPHLVLHAAAHKHVPMMEWNPGEAIKNNVGGTQVVADLADEYGAGAFVLVSTDKAVNPSSVMGATKRVAELYCQSKSSSSETRYVTVRFGNVLGSAGSVVPLFQEQIAAGGPVTVTHPDMQRYFMTIPEACQLILQATSMGNGGEIFVLDMGKPVKIADLARDLIRLSGLQPDTDIALEFTGMRPGEKLFEELSTRSEHADRTRHPKIFIGRLREEQDNELLCRQVGILTDLANHKGARALRKCLEYVVPEYRSPNAELESPLMLDEADDTSTRLKTLSLTGASQ